MSYNGSGTFNINSAGQPVVTGTVISSTAFNALTADLGTGLSTALTKDGQTVATARIPFAAGINSSLVTDATSTTTGSIITAGGVGIAKAVFVGTTLNVAGASTLAGITGSFNGTVGATTPAAGAFTTLSATGITTVAAGSAALPAIVSTTGTADTGLWFPAADTIAASTAGVERMRLDSSGNLGIGTTSPSFRLDVQSATAAQANFQQTNANSYGEIRVTGSSRGGQLEFMNGATRLAGMYADTSNNLIFVNGTGDTERARIDSSGNLGLGVTPSAWSTSIGLKALQVSASGCLYSYTFGGNNFTAVSDNTYLNSGGSPVYIATNTASQYRQTAGAHQWFQAPSGTAGNAITFTQAMTLDASGNLLVGTTSANSSAHHLLQYSDDSKFAAAVVNSSASTTAYGLYIYYSALSPNSTGSEFFYCADPNALRATMRSNGGLANYSANNVNLSDRREKTNFAPATSYLDKICAIPVQTFNYIDQNLEEDDGLTLGVVAQDVQAVAPELVMESNWARKDETPKMRLSIYQTDLQYALMKCIQEQQTIITALTTRITALEAK